MGIITMRKVLALLGSGVMAAAVGTVLATPAGAAACSGTWRYASSTNTVYLDGAYANGVSQTLDNLAAACPAAPLTRVPNSNTWELSADLTIQNGGALKIYGSAAGGDVDTLRLRSSSNNSPTEVSNITAQYGNLDIKSTNITSWDDAAQGPDTDPTVPSGAPTGSQGRAFLRAVSYMDGTTPRESRMDIDHSDLGHLGWYAAESYGVAYKGRGCDATHLDVCAALNVYGSQTYSRFHDNYMGTYTFDARDMKFDGNEYDHNVMYGLDPHDDSDYLTITNNHFHDNGDHGMICSQRCDHLTITGNESDHNGLTPYTPPGDDDPSDNQVHGIMLHRGITATVISNNYIHDQPNGAGIALFDSTGDTISNNTISGNKYGIRLSVGTAGMQISNNTVGKTSQYGIYTYKGTDTPSYTNTGGRPTDNTFSGNTISDASANAVKLTDTDRTTFTGTKLTGTNGSNYFAQSAGTSWQADSSTPSGTRFETHGNSSTRSSTEIRDVTVPISVTTADSYSATDVTSGSGTIYYTSKNVPNTLTSTGSDLRLTSTVSTSAVTVTARPIKILSTGTGTANSATSWSSGVASVSAAAANGASLTFTVAGGRAGNYTVTVGGTVIKSGTSTGGAFSFSYTPSTSAYQTYTIKTG